MIQPYPTSPSGPDPDAIRRYLTRVRQMQDCTVAPASDQPLEMGRLTCFRHGRGTEASTWHRGQPARDVGPYLQDRTPLDLEPEDECPSFSEPPLHSPCGWTRSERARSEVTPLYDAAGRDTV